MFLPPSNSPWFVQMKMREDGVDTDLCLIEQTWQNKCPHLERTATTGRALHAQQAQTPDPASVWGALDSATKYWDILWVKPLSLLTLTNGICIRIHNIIRVFSNRLYISTTIYSHDYIIAASSKIQTHQKLKKLREGWPQELPKKLFIGCLFNIKLIMLSWTVGGIYEPVARQGRGWIILNLEKRLDRLNTLHNDKCRIPPFLW